MNGQDFFADFPSSQSSQKEEQKKGEDDLFAAFSQPQSNIKEEKKESKKENKAKLEDDLFSAFGQPQSNIKEEKKEIKDNKKNVEDDLFAAFSQPQSNTKLPKEDKKENGLSSLIIFVANIKKEGIISTQVEYAFYNSIPEYMNQKLNLSSCYSNSQRRLQNEENGQGVNIDININTNSKVDDYSININIDEIILNVQINFTEKQQKNIDELYNNKGINLFNSSDDFYNDDCNKYTTQEGTDMYLQDRKEQKYIYDALCETGCVQIDYDNITNRVACLCKIKYSEEYYQNVTFSPNELDKKFKQKISFQNWRVVWKCFIKSLKGNSKGKAGSICSLIKFIIYTLLVLVKFNIFGL